MQDVTWDETLRTRYRALARDYRRYIGVGLVQWSRNMSIFFLVFALLSYVGGRVHLSDWRGFLLGLVGAAVAGASCRALLELAVPRTINLTHNAVTTGYGAFSRCRVYLGGGFAIHVHEVSDDTIRVEVVSKEGSVLGVFGATRELAGSIAGIQGQKRGHPTS